ncbi:MULTISPECIES: hypothetical protein [unclassified Mucilaginibacter]|uniref:hypothetical protein n=1 Tax=unclassified Mucilaginibacter TaxID=2617802 RepID=UPI002AC9B726|nr:MULTISPECIES: hypothetical protein [unclassified Mucilaginibacter]MEB0261098.1 hypothetical protein [Mucilaginibacter sp. 10I4]MEB0280473.1 hypothetical protein [Mucilaginibacter sp. 10B2]MEB0303060.1 hypothetical protein [Mucilaginibacter sp. 5C4]WPX22446.1 hypothetical protein RHM67_14255 [Mucilaginibacter sp. 5C4]
MLKDKGTSIENKDLEKTGKKKHKKSLNDGMNTPVPDNTSTHITSESEAALLKQAENPLGDPNKI